MDIIGSIISFIIDASFEVGTFIDELFSLGRKRGPQNPVTAVKRLILSLIGGFIICSITLLIVILIIWAVLKFLF